jgi:hypothetical protein
MAKPAIELIETRQGCEMLESTPRYNVMLKGVKVDQLFYNMRGYVGNLPTPDGSSLYVPESGIARFRREVAKLNREFAAADNVMAAK